MTILDYYVDLKRVPWMVENGKIEQCLHACEKSSARVFLFLENFNETLSL